MICGVLDVFSLNYARFVFHLSIYVRHGLNLEQLVCVLNVELLWPG